MGRLRSGVWASALVLVACGHPALRAAEQGDRARLASEIAGPHARGEISNGDAACLARAVAKQEVTAAHDAPAVARVRELAPCAPELSELFDDLLSHHDAPGGEAALVLQELGAISAGDARRFRGDADPRWRAVAARAFVRSEDQKARRDAILDPDPRVRANALGASAEAGDASDLDLVLETARRDPDPMVKAEAVRTVSALAKVVTPPERLADLTNRLRDLWNAGDDAVRSSVAVAWALSPVFEAGGRDALSTAIAEGKGTGSLAAAGAALGSAHGDDALVAAASALVVRTLREGSTSDRVRAAVFARLAGDELEALRKAARDDDAGVRIVALGRLLASNPDRAAAVTGLEAMAGQGTKGAPSTDRATLVLAARAQFLLAQAGDLRIQAWIEEGLAAPEPFRRLEAASALAALGRSGRAAPLLADADPRVRSVAACTMIRGDR